MCHTDVKEHSPVCALLNLRAAKEFIPRGHRRTYIPCWKQQSNALLKAYETTSDPEIATELINSLNDARRERWTEATENLNFTRSSRKAWSLLRKLSNGGIPCKHNANIKANDFADHLFRTSMIKIPPKNNKSVSKQLSKIKKIPNSNNLASPFNRDEIDAALGSMKIGKAAGVDNILPEFLTNLGPKARPWIAKLFSNILATAKIPKI